MIPRDEGAIAVDTASDLFHTVTTTAANEADVEHIADLLRSKEHQVWADSDCLGAASKVRRQAVQWNIARRHRSIARMPEGRADKQARRPEHNTASIRVRVGHPFRVINRQFGLTTVRFKGLAKNTTYVETLFTLTSIWMARKKLIAIMREVHANPA